MGYPLQLAFRYMGSKKRASISVSTAFAMLGVTLGVAALAIVVSVTGGFQEQFREKVLGVNAHVLVLKYSIDFREYRDVMEKVSHVKGVTGIAPFVINPMMVTHGDRTATGVLLKGVDPERMPTVLDLPKQIVAGSLEGLRKPGAKPPQRASDPFRSDFDLTEDAAKDAGAASDDGGQRSLLDAIEREIQAEDARLDASAHASPEVQAQLAAIDDRTSKPSAPPPPPPIPANALTGSVTPDGGFASALPDSDDIPEFLDPDPCTSPEQVKLLPGVVLGKTLAKQLGVKLGDCVQITSPTIGMSLGSAGGRPPIAKQFRLIAMFEAGFDQYDSKLVYTDLYEAQAFYEQGDSVTGIEMKVDDIDRAQAISKEIERLLANGVYNTMDWQQLNHGLFTALLIQKLGMSAVLGLIVFVASFTVIATVIMVVLDKKKEIAVLKALGARDDAVLRIFLYQGGIIGVVGATLGLLIGYFGCQALVAYAFPLDPKVYFISRLPVNIVPEEFVKIAIFAVGICLAATIFPALYAAHLRPADGLRDE